VNLSAGLDLSLSHQTPDEVGVARIEKLRAAAKILGAEIEQTSVPTRERSLAITKLEEALMWAVKGVVLQHRKPPA
jgi:hypothetical protein